MQKNNQNRKRLPWYENLLPRTPLSQTERTVFAVRGSLPQFRGLLLTLRIIHLFPYQTPTDRDGRRMESNTSARENPGLNGKNRLNDWQDPWHFPGCENSTHHLFLHTRLINKQPNSWLNEVGLVDTTLSMQIVIPGDIYWLRVGSLLEGYEPIDQTLLPISREEKAANLLAGQIGYYLAEKWMPSIDEQWLVERHIDPSSRKTLHIRLLPEERTAERLRISEWSGRMDYCCTTLVDRYNNILERTPDPKTRGDSQ